MRLPPPRSTLFPYTTLFRSVILVLAGRRLALRRQRPGHRKWNALDADHLANRIQAIEQVVDRSEEHTSELQSLTNLVCRLLLDKKKNEHFKDESPLAQHGAS